MGALWPSLTTHVSSALSTCCMQKILGNLLIGMAPDASIDWQASTAAAKQGKSGSNAAPGNSKSKSGSQGAAGKGKEGSNEPELENPLTSAAIGREGRVGAAGPVTPATIDFLTFDELKYGARGLTCLSLFVSDERAPVVSLSCVFYQLSLLPALQSSRTRTFAPRGCSRSSSRRPPPATRPSSSRKSRQPSLLRPPLRIEAYRCVLSEGGREAPWGSPYMPPGDDGDRGVINKVDRNPPRGSAQTFEKTVLVS